MTNGVGRDPFVDGVVANAAAAWLMFLRCGSNIIRDSG